MTPEEHDHAVARISHLPHLLAVLTAARLAGAPQEHLALSGQGVRDVTRVAGSESGHVAADRGPSTPRRCAGSWPRFARSSTHSRTRSSAR